MSAQDNKVQILLLAKSYERIAEPLAQRVPGAEVVCWQPDGTLTQAGKSVSADRVAPSVGWIGSDIFAGKHMRAYGDALLSFASMRWVQSANAGLDMPVYKRLAGQAVRISKSGAQSIPIAEYVLAYALENCQKLVERRAAQARSEWKPHLFGELWHATWLLIGYGHIGRGVARRAKAFDSHVIAIRASGAADEYADEVASLADLPQLLPRANIVLLACPATDDTRGLANAAFFEQLAPDTLFINIARGSLVDEAALLSALDRGKPAHAVLDVFESEPLPADNPLWTHPNVTVTAHTSNAGSGTRQRGDELFLSNLERFVAGDALLDEVVLASIV